MLNFSTIQMAKLHSCNEGCKLSTEAKTVFVAVYKFGHFNIGVRGTHFWSHPHVATGPTVACVGLIFQACKTQHSTISSKYAQRKCQGFKMWGTNPAAYLFYKCLMQKSWT